MQGLMTSGIACWLRSLQLLSAGLACWPATLGTSAAHTPIVGKPCSCGHVSMYMCVHMYVCKAEQAADYGRVFHHSTSRVSQQMGSALQQTSTAPK